MSDVSKRPSLRGNAPVPFTDEFAASVAQSLTEALKYHLGDETLTVKGEVAHGHVQASVDLRARDDSFLLHLEVGMELEPNQIDDPFVGRDKALDFLQTLLLQYCEEERQERFHPQWKAYDNQQWVFMVRGEVSNPALEAEADRWLAMADE